MQEKRRYVAAGTVIESEIDLPDLGFVADVADRADGVSISYGKVDEHLSGEAEVGPAFEATKTSFLLRTPQLRCRVDDGRRVTIERLSCGDDDTVRTFVLGAALPALCHQRGLVPLSATAVEFNGQAIVVMGESGSGKSTVGALLVKRGYPLLSDGIVAVCGEPHPRAYAVSQRLGLWRDVLDFLSVDSSLLASDRSGLQRYGVVPERVVAGPLELRRLYVLEPRPDAAPGCFEPLIRLDALNAVSELSRLPWLASLANGPEKQFRHLVAIAGGTTMVRWARRLEFGECEAQLDAFEADLRAAP